MPKPARLLLEVRPSPIDGRGLFAVSRIHPRHKIGELAGQVISQREARRRARHKRRINIVEFGDGRAMDASISGNIFRYINHSCVPNAYMRIFHGHVEFYALRLIHPGEEITCRYGETHHAGKLRCNCGSAYCQGSL